MQATILRIDRRERRSVSQIAALTDFTTTADAQIDAQQIIDNPDISLYCLDDTQQRAIFAELSPKVDLASAPFCYQAQFDNARRLIAVPYEAFHELAAGINIDDSKLILIHNIGRCGSTLVKDVFNQLDDVVCLSEPDVFSNFAALRHQSRPTLNRLLQSSLRLMFRPAVAGQAATYGLKFRNQCVEIMDLYAAAFPRARHLFLYRGVLGWTASLERLMSRHGARPPLARMDALARCAAYNNRTLEQVERFFDPAVADYSTATFLATSWLLMMDRCLELSAQGFSPLAVRYEDLNTRREAVIAAIFEYCGLPLAAVQVALQAFSRDSQQGTRLARERSDQGSIYALPEAQITQIRAILKRHPVIQTPDFLLPGTLTA